MNDESTMSHRTRFVYRSKGDGKLLYDESETDYSDVHSGTSEKLRKKGEDIKIKLQSKVERAAKKYAYTEKDLLKLLKDEEGFRKMKQALRQKGAITNGYLREHMHLLVYSAKQDVKMRKKKAQGKKATTSKKRTEEMLSPSSSQ